MSDPIFLRSLISNTVYAEQMNSGQIQGQQAARERAAHVQAERIKHEAEQIQKAEDSAAIDVEKDGRNGREQSSGKKRRGGGQAPVDDTAVLEERLAASIDLNGHFDLMV